jgi:hypothetical protein
MTTERRERKNNQQRRKDNKDASHNATHKIYEVEELL